MVDVWSSFSSGAQTGLGLMEAYKGKLQEEESKKYLADAATALTTSDDTAQQAPGAQAPAPVTEVAKAPVGQGGLTAGQGMGPQAYAKTQPQQATEAPKGFDTGAAALTPPQLTAPRLNATIKMAMQAGASPKTIDQLMKFQDRARLNDTEAMVQYNTQRAQALEDVSREVSVAGSEADLYGAIRRSPFGRDPQFMKQVSSFISDPRVPFAEKRSRFEELGVSSKERLANENKSLKTQLDALKATLHDEQVKLQELGRNQRAAASLDNRLDIAQLMASTRTTAEERRDTKGNAALDRVDQDEAREADRINLAAIPEKEKQKKLQALYDSSDTRRKSIRTRYGLDSAEKPAAAPVATKSQADFDTKWKSLKAGESLVGPDGTTYTKK